MEVFATPRVCVCVYICVNPLHQECTDSEGVCYPWGMCVCVHMCEPSSPGVHRQWRCLLPLGYVCVYICMNPLHQECTDSGGGCYP